MVPPPTTVTSADVKKGDWQPMLTAVGSISPVQGAMISAELAGTVAERLSLTDGIVKNADNRTVRYGELVADLPAQGSRLRKLQVMGIRGGLFADQAGLFTNKEQMALASSPQLLGKRQAFRSG